MTKLLMISFLIAVAPTFPVLAASCKAPRLTQGIEYQNARKIALKAGFQASMPPAYGYKENDEKVMSECNGDVSLCNRYPEIDACSGDGHCAMRFTDAYKNELSVFTYGDITNGSATVTGFEMKCAK